MSRMQTPDILGALMGESKKIESNKASLEESNKARKQPSNKPIKQESNKPTQLFFEGCSNEELPPVEEPKEKATFNLPVKLLSELESKWMELRKLSGSKQISKTSIVEVALEMAFAEFEQKGQSGKLYSKLASNKAIKQ